MGHVDPDQAKEYQRQYYRRNRERLLAASRARRAIKRSELNSIERERYRADPAAGRARVALYRDANRTAIQDRQRATTDPVSNRAKVLQWQRDNPEYVALRSKRRRARKLDAFVEDVDSLVVLERSDGVCGICEHDVDPLNFHVDHIIPLSRGGEHSYSNVQAAHPACNASKGASIPW